MNGTAAEIGFVIQYGERKAELAWVLGGGRTNEAVELLRRHDACVGVNRIVHLLLGQGKQLRVVRGCKHLGATTSATLRFDSEVAARATAASCAESAVPRDMCAQSELPRQIRVNIVGAIQASLLYAACTRPSL